MSSGDTSLMKGNSDPMAILAAKAVFPAPGGPLGSVSEELLVV